MKTSFELEHYSNYMFLHSNSKGNFKRVVQVRKSRDHLSSTIKGIIIFKIHVHFKTADTWISLYYSLKDDLFTYKKRKKKENPV